MTDLTELERHVLDLVARENWPEFRADALSAARRENTGAGRYTYLKDGRGQTLANGSYSAQGRMVELPGARNGLGFVVEVSSSAIHHIEFFTFGNDGWNGDEGGWKII